MELSLVSRPRPVSVAGIDDVVSFTTQVAFVLEYHVWCLPMTVITSQYYVPAQPSHIKLCKSIWDCKQTEF